jgi:hypothetical protein
VIEPDVRRGLHANSVTTGVPGGDFADRDVADDDVLCVADEEPKTCEAGRGVEAEDGFVAADTDLRRAGDFAFDVDCGCGVVFDCGKEGGVGADCD